MMPGLPHSTPEKDIEMFRELFENPDYAVRRRRFYKPLETQADGLERDRFQPVLDVSLDNGSNWIRLNSFKLAKDECKLTITYGNLRKLIRKEGDTEVGDNYITALKKGTLIVDLWATIRNDRRLMRRAIIDTTSATRFVRQTVSVDPKLRWQGPSPDASVNPAIVSVDNIKTIEDASECKKRADDKQAVTQDGVLDGKPFCPGINLQFAPGQMVNLIEGRNISLVTSRAGAERFPHIVAVKYMFGSGKSPRHYTVLSLDVKRT